MCRFEVLDEEPGDDEESGGQRLICLLIHPYYQELNFLFAVFLSQRLYISIL
jgi:hypothetical protein